MRAWNVGIIGGGPGGLMAAYELQQLSNQPLNVTLFEASGRLGGKILTPQFRAAPVAYEAGAAEFYDYSQFGDDPLKELVEDLGLPMTRMGGSAVILQDRVISNVDDLHDQLGLDVRDTFLRFDLAARNRMTPREFYYSDEPDGAQELGDDSRFDALLNATLDGTSRRYLESMIHSDLATEPSRTSVAYGLQNYLMNDPAYMHLYGIQGGNERLIAELQARSTAIIHLNERVTRIRRAEHGQLELQTIRADVARSETFDFVIVALPHNAIKSIHFEGPRLQAAVEAHYEYYNYPAHYLRMTLLFRSQFWREHLTDSYWMLDSFGGCCLYDESSRIPGCSQGVLGWLLGGAAALDLSELSDEELISEALDSLPASLQRGRDELLEGRVNRWIGAVNALPGGRVMQSLDRRHQPEPLEHSNLFFVGDYLFDSTLNGVLDSAQYVAAWIVASIQEKHESAL